MRWKLSTMSAKGIGFPVLLSSSFSLLFVEQPWVIITSACLLITLTAAVIAFWVSLVRTYDGREPAANQVAAAGSKEIK